MSLRPSSLRSFLVSARNHLHSSIRQRTPVTLVFGNESCDLDSFTSCVLYAYLVSSTVPPAQIHVPVLNIPRSDLQLRSEFLALLPHANIEAHHLLTASDLPSSAGPAGADAKAVYAFAEQVSAVLVDHNVPAGPLAPLAGRIIGVVDHHVDENKISAETSPRIVTPAGSCTSLVYRHLRPAWENLTGAASSSSRNPGAQDDNEVGVEDLPVRRVWDSQVAKLALASVLIDTEDLQDVSKTTQLDRQTVTELLGKIGSIEPKFDQHAFFKELENAKAALDGFTVEDVMRKDYKSWGSLGIASTVKKMDWLAKQSKEKDGRTLEECIKAFKEDRKLSSMVVMTAFEDDAGQYTREIAVIGDLETTLVEQAGKDLELQDWKGTQDVGNLKVWKQGDIKKSRKQVAPILRKIVGT